MKLSDFEKSLKIDKHDLDEETIRQPELVWHAGEELASANEELAQAERQKANLAAELAESIRSDMNAAGEKITIDAVEKKIRNMPQMRELNDELISLKHQAELWLAMTHALRARGDGLKLLTQQHAANYFVRESLGKHHRDEMQENADRVREARGRKAAGVR